MINNKAITLIRKLMHQILICFGLIFTVVIIAILLLQLNLHSSVPKPPEIILNAIAAKYDISLLENTSENEIIKFGYKLFTNTSIHIGPNNEDSSRIYAGNKLECNNCHLQAGTKLYAAPLIGIVNRFPQFRGRENKIGTIEERINGCFERSMNGKALPINSIEMKAFVAYFEWLSRHAPENGKVEGQGFIKIEIPNRKVDLYKGEQIYTTICIKCHGNTGKGQMNLDLLTYKYPPLWGDDSYNNGAGMNRVITSAQFIKANMPFGTTYEAPLLTDEEAYDVAGYINQQQRPLKAKRELDFPDLKNKPVSTPYPPFLDSFPIQQHQLGPFQPIMEFYKREYNIIKTK
tara:strand:+ start:61306 stop:62346 length:1041 start_codon:yes stop_codon:yes gene_type:complete